jgi:hypothetical protein
VRACVAHDVAADGGRRDAGLRGRLAELRVSVAKARLAPSAVPVPAPGQASQGGSARVSGLSDGEVCAALEQLLSRQKCADWGEYKVGARVFALIMALPPPVHDEDLEPLNVLQLCVRVVEECRRQRASLLLPPAAHSSTGRLGEGGEMVASIARLDLLRAAAQTVMCPEAPATGRGRKGRLKRLGECCKAFGCMTPSFECCSSVLVA